MPEKVRILFDTARNLYLYAWFVYRFYNVAEQQAFACLEMALRERLKKEMPLPEKYWPKRRQKQPPTLKSMLRYVIDRGYIRNEGFRIWRNKGIIQARYRYQNEKMQEMKKKGLNSIELDYSKAVVTNGDLLNEVARIVRDRCASRAQRLLTQLKVVFTEARGKFLHHCLLKTFNILAYSSWSATQVGEISSQ